MKAKFLIAGLLTAASPFILFGLLILSTFIPFPKITVDNFNQSHKTGSYAVELYNYPQEWEFGYDANPNKEGATLYHKLGCKGNICYILTYNQENYWANRDSEDMFDKPYALADMINCSTLETRSDSTQQWFQIYPRATSYPMYKAACS